MTERPKTNTQLNWKRILVAALLVGSLVYVGAAWWIGGQLVAPANRTIGAAPEGLPVESFSVDSESGSTIAGWYVPNLDAQATVVLLHPIRSNRKSMLGRARLFHEAGFAIVMVDLQAHGESPGEHITIGHLESHDVTATIEWARNKNQDHKIGVVGCSLGGAATLLAAPIKIDALVLESVYPNVKDAVYNRVGMRLGVAKHLIAPALLMQLKPRLGIGAEDLRPIDGLPKLTCPVLIASGDQDRHTTIAETEEMFSVAVEPKQLVVFEGAEHEDLLKFDTEFYRQKVMAFVERHLVGDVDP